MAATIVLVHGAWHGAWCWEKLRTELDARGIPSLAVDLPGHGASPEPLGDLYGDAAHVASVLGGLGTDAVLVGHSYGGAVITEAAAGRHDVRHLVYLAAFCAEAGETVMGLAGSVDDRGDLGAAIRPQDDGTLLLDPAAAVPALYGDCDDADVERALRLLGPQPASSFGQPLRATAWADLPSTYVVCTDDRAIPAPLQRAMAQRCGTQVELAASHSPFLSMPGALADLLAPLVP